jgi:hypothetical protein
MEFVEEPGWHERVMEFAHAAQDKVARDVLADMKAIVPVDTGALRESLDLGRIDDTTVRVGSKDKDYSVYVEEGHRIVAWGHETGRFQPPQPYMRPALFRERSL